MKYEDPVSIGNSPSDGLARLHLYTYRGHRMGIGCQPPMYVWVIFSPKDGSLLLSGSALHEESAALMGACLDLDELLDNTPEPEFTTESPEPEGWFWKKHLPENER